MAETLVLSAPEQIIPPFAEAPAMAQVANGVGQTAVEQILRTDPAAAFEWPAGTAPTRGVTYTAPTGDA